MDHCTHSFPKREKLCGKLRIAALYKSGRRFVAFPMRVTYARVPSQQSTLRPDELLRTQIQMVPTVLIWAPKSLFKHAVDRNRLRRLMREAYRLENQPLCAYCASHGISLHIAFNYIDKEIRSQAELRAAMQKAIRKLIRQLDAEQQTEPKEELK